MADFSYAPVIANYASLAFPLEAFSFWCSTHAKHRSLSSAESALSIWKKGKFERSCSHHNSVLNQLPQIVQYHGFFSFNLAGKLVTRVITVFNIFNVKH